MKTLMALTAATTTGGPRSAGPGSDGLSGRLRTRLCLAQPVQAELIERKQDGDDHGADPVDGEYQQRERSEDGAADAE